MNKNEQITKKANEILVCLEEDKLDDLPQTLLKASYLSTLLGSSENADIFRGWAKDAEYKVFEINSYAADIEAAKDPNVSISSANPNQFVNSFGNGMERNLIRKQARVARSALAAYSTETYVYALGIYNKWRFGNITETIFEKKRQRTDKVLQKAFPDANNRLSSINDNLLSANPEDWKNAVVSCRTLLMELADSLNPDPKKLGKDDYVNWLKDYISLASKTKTKLYKSLLSEVEKRIEYTVDLTQGAAHRTRPLQQEAEDIVLLTYLVISELMARYIEKNKDNLITQLKESPTEKTVNEK